VACALGFAGVASRKGAIRISAAFSVDHISKHRLKLVQAYHAIKIELIYPKNASVEFSKA
jgi:hypothetical protein